MLNEDYKEILQIFIKNDVRFLLVGAYAMGVHGYPRATGDIDIWVDSSQKNSKNIYQSLAEFGVPLEGVQELTFFEKGIVFQIGLPPRRIDIITHIDGVVFDEAYLSKVVIHVEELDLPFLSINDLIKNKESTGRDKDLLDVKNLRKILNIQRDPDE